MNCYIKWGPLYFWDMGNGDRSITTCSCAPFKACGCWSVKLSPPSLPKVSQTLFWGFSVYILKLWVDVHYRKIFRTGFSKWFITWGFARKVG